MLVVRDKAEMRAWSRARRAAGRSVAFVPTMGALHEGHLSLAALAAARADDVVASVYVNPTQFAPGEDFASYPRDDGGDCAKLESAGVAVAFMPRDMYDSGSETRVLPGALAAGLCGGARPHFFEGVCTVVAKLLNVVVPDVLVLGKKDYQQLCVVRRMVRDLDMGVEVVGGETARAEDGLALSSRNARLSPAARASASALPAALASARARAAEGGEGARAAALRAGVAAAVEAAGGAVEYAEVVHPEHLAPLEEVGAGGALLAVAAEFGGVRLLDNVELAPVPV